MIKKSIILSIIIALLFNSTIAYTAKNNQNIYQYLFTGAEQINAIELTEYEIENSVTEPETEHGDEISLQSSIPAFYSYGNDYGCNYLGTIQDSEELQYCYNTIEAMCYDFCLETGNIPSTTYSNGTIVYKLSSKDYSFSLSPEQAIAVYYIFRMDHPQYYWLSSTLLYFSLPSGKTRLIPCIYEDYYKYSVRNRLNSIIDTNIQQFIENIQSVHPQSKHNIIKQIHDDIVEATDYGYDSDNNPLNTAAAHNIVSVFDGENNADTVCDGYAKAMQIILNAVGINNILVIGKANGNNHAWNLAQFDDDNYYYLDLTWDDSTNSYDYFARGTDFFIGNATNKHNPYLPTGSGDEFLYELPQVPEYDYTYIEPTVMPSQSPTDEPSPAATYLPEDYDLDIIFEKTESENIYHASLTNDIPDFCNFYIATYDINGKLLSVNISSESIYIETSDEANVMKGFVFYDNLKPCVDAVVLDLSSTPTPTETPSPTDEPMETPTPEPAEQTTDVPSEVPTATDEPTETPTPEPAEQVTEMPSEIPTATDEPAETPTEFISLIDKVVSMHIPLTEYAYYNKIQAFLFRFIS